MKTTTHKIKFDGPAAEAAGFGAIEEWLAAKYGPHPQINQLKVVRTGLGAEIHVEYSFANFDDANKFYRRPLMKLMRDLQQSFSARIAGQSSCPTDYAD